MLNLSAAPLGAEAALASLVLDALDTGESPLALLADVAAALPEPLRGPDATPSLPTGASDVARADAFTYAALAAAPRLLEAFGPVATGVEVGGESFVFAESYVDPESGFNAVQLRSLSDDRAVFAVDGTDFESLPDVVADLDLGRPQVDSPAFAAMVADATAAALAEDRDVVFTGASLGGALVQVGGYETAEAVLAASPADPDRVTVFTVDPLGGRDAAEDLNGGALDQAVLERMDALNIRTEGDVVSRTGSHLGDTLSFQAVDSAGNPVQLPAEDAHVNLESLFATLSSDELFAAGVRGDPGEIGGLTLLANTFGPGASEVLVALLPDGLPGADEPDGLPAGGSIDPSGGFFGFDPDTDGDVDLRVALRQGAGDGPLIA